MLNHTVARRCIARILAVPFAAVVAMLSGRDTWAQPADDLPPPSEPWLAEPGDWAADFNDAQTACYNGSMGACDSIWLSQRVLIDTPLHNYGYTCGGRVDRRGVVHCTEIFPGHE